MLVDSYNRKLNYLRLSITERCNLHCIYCMPVHAPVSDSIASELSFDEFLSSCSIMTELGINRIRVTGGEPLLRPGLASLIKTLKDLSSGLSVYLTSNANLLKEFFIKASSIKSFPNGINISLDALNPESLKKISGNMFNSSDLLKTIDKLLDKNVSVKINCVPIAGFNEEELVPLAMLVRDRTIDVRFIELMPIGSAVKYKNINARETAEKIEKAIGKLSPCDAENKEGGPALYYNLPGFSGRIGFINPMSHSFCDSCNRLRLSSRGKLKLCLSSNLELDLIDMLRKGLSIDSIKESISEFILNKPYHHDFINSKQTYGMYIIGG